MQTINSFTCGALSVTHSATACLLVRTALSLKHSLTLLIPDNPTLLLLGDLADLFLFCVTLVLALGYREALVTHRVGGPHYLTAGGREGLQGPAQHHHHHQGGEPRHLSCTESGLIES